MDWQFPVSVWDVVMMGRYGAMNFLRIPRAIDKAKVEKACAGYRCGTSATARSAS